MIDSFRQALLIESIKKASKYLKIASLLFIPFIIAFSVTNYCDVQHAGLAYNRITGESWLQGPGIHFTAPWTAVSVLETRPQRICIESAARSSKCLLVQFKKEAFRDLIATEGFRYYWWDNRFSFNMGHREEYRGFHNLMLGYAYADASFLTIKEEF